MNSVTDHDLLIRIDERVDKIGHDLSNHLKHHWVLTISLTGALLSTLAALLVSLVGGAG